MAWIATKHFMGIDAISYDSNSSGWLLRCADNEYRFTFSEIIDFCLQHKHKQHSKQFIYCQTFLYAFADLSGLSIQRSTPPTEFHSQWLPLYLHCIQAAFDASKGKEESYCGNLFMTYPCMFYMREIPTKRHVYTFSRAFSQLKKDTQTMLIELHEVLQMKSKLSSYLSADHFLHVNEIYPAIEYNYRCEKNFRQQALSEAVLRRCNEGHMLNDEVVNFYVDYLNQQSHFSSCCFVFSSHFWTKLTQSAVDSVAHNWYSSRVLCSPSTKYWFIPVHSGCHWCLLVVVNPYKQLCYGTGRVYFLDSFGKSPEDVHDNMAGTLSNYMAARLLAEHKDPESHKITNILCREDILCPIVPQQNNEIDCGVFMLQYIECFLESPLKDGGDHKNWFSLRKIREKRLFLRSIIRLLAFKRGRKRPHNESYCCTDNKKILLE